MTQTMRFHHAASKVGFHHHPKTTKSTIRLSLRLVLFMLLSVTQRPSRLNSYGGYYEKPKRFSVSSVYVTAEDGTGGGNVITPEM